MAVLERPPLGLALTNEQLAEMLARVVDLALLEHVQV